MVMEMGEVRDLKALQKASPINGMRGGDERTELIK